MPFIDPTKPPYPSHLMGRHVRVVMENPQDTYETTINGTDQDIRRYFVGQTLNLGRGPDDRMVKCVDVIFL